MRAVPTEPYPELPWVVGELAGGVRAELGGALLGVYLVGSLATGDFDLDSDVDFLAVTARELADDEVRRLEAMHGRLHGLGCYPAEHLEGSYVSAGTLARADAVGSPLWYIDNGDTTLQRSPHDNYWHVRWILRERGVTLAGPPPESLLPPVPARLLRAETLAVLRREAAAFAEAAGRSEGAAGEPEFYGSRFGQSFAVLNGCRMLQTIEAGEVRSKRAGLAWARRELGGGWRRLLDQAWAEREGVRFMEKIRQHADPALMRETARLLAHLLEEGERRGGGGGGR